MRNLTSESQKRRNLNWLVALKSCKHVSLSILIFGKKHAYFSIFVKWFQTTTPTSISIIMSGRFCWTAIQTATLHHLQWPVSLANLNTIFLKKNRQNLLNKSSPILGTKILERMKVRSIFRGQWSECSEPQGAPEVASWQRPTPTKAFGARVPLPQGAPSCGSS